MTTRMPERVGLLGAARDALKLHLSERVRCPHADKIRDMVLVLSGIISEETAKEKETQ